MQSHSIALVPEAEGISPSDLLRVSAALQKQVSTQFGPVWEVQATVDAFAELEDVPAGYRSIVVSSSERIGVEPGVHLDENGQPYARVVMGPGWSIAASRACLEMLANPYGQRTLNAPSPRSDQGPAEVLVEVCAGFGNAHRAYAVNDVPVSDFVTPAYYDAPTQRGSERFSFRGGAFTAPLQLLRGGHLSWFDAISNAWWLRTFHEEHPNDLSLGSLRLGGRSVRSLIMAHEPMHALALLHHDPLDARVGLSWLREQASLASRARAQQLRAILSGALDASNGILINGPVELPASALASPSYGRLRPVPSPRAEVTREPPRNYERELRDVVASEIDAAGLDATEEASIADEREEQEERVVQSVTREPVVTVPAHQPAATILPPKSAASANRHTPALKVHPSIGDTKLGIGVQQLEPALQSALPPAQPAAPFVQPAAPAASAAPSQSFTPPPLPPARPSSIAPVAMLDNDRKADNSRLGMVLIGAAAAALAVAGWMRSGDAKSAAPTVAPVAAPAVTQPAPAANVAPVAPVAPAANVAPTPAQPAAPAPVVTALPERAPSAPAPAPTAKLERSAKPSEPSEVAHERQRARRAVKEAAAAPTPAPESAAPKTQPVAAIESLFDTRR